ncbi:unnamed protein product [Linum tenue]|uniref:B box-type domain-containing protein n=1 Tax=Linum tenue TaxID=586396 RepID=A0AAV0I7E9_9ROSI|nr:unnamed protein product [Linum tenue]
MGKEDRFSNYYSNNCYSSSSSAAAAAVVTTRRRSKMSTKKKKQQEVPAWLSGLMGERFFGSCVVHEERRKNEKNAFCLLCCHAICPHCLPAEHHTHPFLQVRRYVYHDVVRVGDLEKLIDCSYIQSYTINSAKVIFVSERARSRSVGKAATAHNTCFACHRMLQHHFHFCSLFCKVNHMVEEGEQLGSILVTSGGTVGGGTMNQAVVDDDEEAAAGSEDMAFSQFEDLRMDGSSEITDDQLFVSSSSTTASTSDQMSKKKKKKKKAGISALSFGSRRKGAPHRAPLS